ncbi:type VI secretion system amidase effector protein Tae4 [Caldimonas brevitalea]|uniref:Type VI secretion system (T6SS) effector Tae4 (Amidase) n=1 Tax=Caldimonas brevitalea TaxID=413882 RepID=A0A0G3BLR7_9BURK|nr:type VI secretion system amidase effector protein Tae4 [Caldimonas brevitalea]AKJ28938.1 hypothetical protein AAW51_2247 [Caldimonas brevitalea]
MLPVEVTGREQHAYLAQLWANHPNVKGDGPLLDKSVYENQCAIGVSAALMRSGVNMKAYSGVWSWQKDKPKYAIRAQELASWLASGAAHLPTRFQKYTGDDVKNIWEKVEDRTGVIFFRDYYGPGMQGDHIDLRNGSRMTALSSWVRINLRVGPVGLGSDHRKSSAVWFWEMP